MGCGEIVGAGLGIGSKLLGGGGKGGKSALGGYGQALGDYGNRVNDITGTLQGASDHAIDYYRNNLNASVDRYVDRHNDARDKFEQQLGLNQLTGKYGELGNIASDAITRYSEGKATPAIEQQVQQAEQANLANARATYGKLGMQGSTAAAKDTAGIRTSSEINRNQLMAQYTQAVTQTASTIMSQIAQVQEYITSNEFDMLQNQLQAYLSEETTTLNARMGTATNIANMQLQAAGNMLSGAGTMLQGNMQLANQRAAGIGDAIGSFASELGQLDFGGGGVDGFDLQSGFGFAGDTPDVVGTVGDGSLAGSIFSAF